MIAMGRSIDEIRNSEHPFGQALEAMEECHLVCSAPMAALLAGEHAGVDGALMIAAPLRARVYVGFLGRVQRKKDAPHPMLHTFRYYDPLSDDIVDTSHNPDYLGRAEHITNIGRLLWAMANKFKLKFLPAEIAILSEAPPGRGANWSGAFSASIALGMYLLQGGDHREPHQLRTDYWNGRTDTVHELQSEIHQIFQMAMIVECASHTLASGYGPAVSLLPALGNLFLYKGFICKEYAAARGDPRRNCDFFLAHWRCYQERLQAKEHKRLSDVYDVLLVDSGRPKSTADKIEGLRKVQEAALVDDIVSHISESQTDAKELFKTSECAADRILQDRRVGTISMAVLSILVAKTLRDCLAGVEDDAGAVLRVIQSLDHIHRRVKLSFLELDELRRSAGFQKDLKNHRLAIKLTGGGGGGDIVVWGVKEAITGKVPRKQLCKTRRCPTVIWRLTRDGLAETGARTDHTGSSNHSLPYSPRQGTFPPERSPGKHIAMSIDAKGHRTTLLQAPATIFEVYRALRNIALDCRGPCIYLYFWGNTQRDCHEPIYLAWRKDSENLEVVSAQPHEGGPLLKQLLISFMEQGTLVLDCGKLSYMADKGGQFLENATCVFTQAQRAMSKLNQQAKVRGCKEFPSLHRERKRKKRGSGKILEFNATLDLPPEARLFTIRPADE